MGRFLLVALVFRLFNNRPIWFRYSLRFDEAIAESRFIENMTVSSANVPIIISGFWNVQYVEGQECYTALSLSDYING